MRHKFNFSLASMTRDGAHTVSIPTTSEPSLSIGHTVPSPLVIVIVPDITRALSPGDGLTMHVVHLQQHNENDEYKILDFLPPRSQTLVQSEA